MAFPGKLTLGKYRTSPAQTIIWAKVEANVCRHTASHCQNVSTFMRYQVGVLNYMSDNSSHYLTLKTPELAHSLESMTQFRQWKNVYYFIIWFYLCSARPQTLPTYAQSYFHKHLLELEGNQFLLLFHKWQSKRVQQRFVHCVHRHLFYRVVGAMISRFQMAPTEGPSFSDPVESSQSYDSGSDTDLRTVTRATLQYWQRENRWLVQVIQIRLVCDVAQQKFECFYNGHCRIISQKWLRAPDQFCYNCTGTLQATH